MVYRLAQAERYTLGTFRRRYELLDTRLRHQDMRVRLGATRRRLEGLENDLRTQEGNLLTIKQSQLVTANFAFVRAAENVLLARRSHLEGLHGRLQALSPTAILSRGYALVFDASGRLVKDASQLKLGDSVRARLGHGEFSAEVKRISRDRPTE